eukprot:4396653-Amphidinium_carterae.1
MGPDPGLVSRPGWSSPNGSMTCRHLPGDHPGFSPTTINACLYSVRKPGWVGAAPGDFNCGQMLTCKCRNRDGAGADIVTRGWYPRDTD